MISKVKKRMFAGLSTVLLLAGLCANACAMPTQIYTSNYTAEGVTAKGGLYGNRASEYIVSASSTTFASGSVDYIVDVTTIVYGKGDPGRSSGSDSQQASQSASAQSGTIIMTKDDDCKYISSMHSATVYAKVMTPITIGGLAMDVWGMN